MDAEIERLFDVDFLTRVARIPAQEGGGPDGGLHTTRLLSPPGSGGLLQATYRGRTAESGGTEGSAEPKQSWEFRRCRGGDAASAHSSSSVDNNEPAKNSPSSASEEILAKTLPRWTDALHSVATAVVDALGVPPGSVLARTGCSGHCSLSEKQPISGRQMEGCCVDLLRVFRYDALPTDSDRAERHGSSEHTDWGSLTVVWQDGSGGLQAWCVACQRWNDVPPARSTKSFDEGEAEEREELVELFVHVGDFLSLASGSSWPSPRHRVLCPVRDISGGVNVCDEGSIEGRSSLVYFAYPPPGVCMAGIEPILSLLKNDESQDNESELQATLPYRHYMLLQDQSSGSDRGEGVEVKEARARAVYDRIRNTPFDEVIQEKWGQVQRG